MLLATKIKRESCCGCYWSREPITHHRGACWDPGFQQHLVHDPDVRPSEPQELNSKRKYSLTGKDHKHELQAQCKYQTISEVNSCFWLCKAAIPKHKSHMNFNQNSGFHTRLIWWRPIGNFTFSLLQEVWRLLAARGSSGTCCCPCLTPLPYRCRWSWGSWQWGLHCLLQGGGLC